MSRLFSKEGPLRWFATQTAGTTASRKRAGASDRVNKSTRLSKKQVTYVLRHMANLLENGLSLPRALGTLAEEDATEGYREILVGLKRKLEGGESFSRALTAYPATFDAVLVSQIKVGERAGSVAESLCHAAEQREKTGKLKAEILKKLAYPMVLVVLGSAAITFLLTYVVPVFEETYRKAHVPLPAITQALIYLGAFARHYLGWVVGLIVVVVVLVRQVRRNEKIALGMDQALFRIPIAGNWFRDLALLQIMEVVGDLLQAGFTLAEALNEAAGVVTNRVAKHSLRGLQQAVSRGERFSREMERHAEFFPPIVSQLVIIGEQTGQLPRSTRYIRSHLQEEIERKANVFVAAIEPILTLSLASAVAVILLAIYLPMFDMFNAVAK